jgi:hypothetical protein
VPDPQLTLLCQPDVGFDACATSCNRCIEWHATPVVIVRVAVLRHDIATEVVSPFVLEGAVRIRLCPVGYDMLQPAVGLWWG